MEKTKSNRVKGYAIAIGIVSLAAQHGIYLLAHLIAELVGIPPFEPKIAAIDDLIPLLPVFIIPYIWSYVFWAMAPMAVSKCETKHFLNYMATYLFACAAGAIILIFAPTFMNRAGMGLMDEAAHPGVFGRLMRFWYSLDGGDMAYNLFPSFHCINSTVSFLGVYRRKEIPKWFRIYSLVTAILIYASTVCVKQHYILDVISGIAIGILSYVICMKADAGRIFRFNKRSRTRRFRGKRKTRGAAELPEEPKDNATAASADFSVRASDK